MTKREANIGHFCEKCSPVIRDEELNTRRVQDIGTQQPNPINSGADYVQIKDLPESLALALFGHDPGDISQIIDSFPH